MIHATQPSWWSRLGRLLRKRILISTILLAGVALGILMVAVARSRPDGNLHIWFLDLGHSNAVLVQTPGGAHMLVDGGRYPSRLLTAIGDRIPFTDREIEVLVITQPDEFDTAALPAVLERYDVGVALTNGQPNLSDNFLAIQDALAGHDVAVVRAGYSLDVDDGVHLEVLHPQEQPDLTDSFDLHTVVLRLTYGDVSFLLTSDVNAAAQSTLLDAGEWPLATVLQLPHHGAARSLDTDFLDAVQPQVIVLESDPANRLGDPHPDTLALLPEDVPLFRTDESGTIHLWTDGTNLWVEEEG